MNLAHVSASQIKRFLQCPAQWGFQYLDHLEEPERFDTDGRATGTLYHQEHEAWFLDGCVPKFPSLSRLVEDPAYPRRHGGLLIEHPRDYKLDIEAAGVKVKGRADLLDFGDPAHPLIVDLKSLKDLKWALDEEALTRDTQLLIYAHYVFEKYPAAERVTLIHGVVSTSSPEYRIVRSEPITREHVAPRYAEIESVVRRMVAAAERQSGTELDQHFGPACRAYRGCPFQQHCPAYRRNNPEVVFAMDIEAKVAARSQQVNPPDAAPPVPTPSKPAPAPTTTSSTVAGLHLYVDCHPTKTSEPVVFLEDLIADVAAPICKQHGVADVRQVKFGEGTAALAAVFRAFPPKGHVVARSGGLSLLVLEVLRPVASVVVEG